LSFDKAVYLPGEAATITVQALDATGLPVSGKTHANLFAVGGITSNYAFGGSSDVLTATSITTDTATVKSYKVFMPLVENVVTISATGGSSLPVAGQVVVTASTGATLTVEQADASANIPVVSLEQDDTNESFIAFVGSSGAASANSISSSTGSTSSKIGAIRVKINGTDRWIRLYDTAE
jgi:hypothetical protein